jgi:hypothetical protein
MMSSPSLGKHASGTTSNRPAVPEPSFAERARTLMHSGEMAASRPYYVYNPKRVWHHSWDELFTVIPPRGPAVWLCS